MTEILDRLKHMRRELAPEVRDIDQLIEDLEPLDRPA